jgi:hypothetical protein
MAVSPAPRELGRQRPEAASLFRPLLFNFAADYEDGSVLDFQVGFTRQELLDTLLGNYARTGVLAAACGRESGAPPLTVAHSQVAPSDRNVVSDLLERDVICLYVPARHIVLIFHVLNGHVDKIKLSYIRNELI